MDPRRDPERDRDPRAWRTLFRCVLERRGAFAGSVALGALASFLEVASIGLVGPLLLVNESGVAGRLGVFSRVLPLLEGLSPNGQRAVLVSMILGAIAIRGAAWWAAAALKESVASGVHACVRSRVFARLARAPMAYLQARPLGDQHALVLHETDRVSAAASSLVQVSMAVIMAVCYAGLLFYLAPLLTLAALGFLACVAAAIRLLRRPIERYAHRMREESRSLSATIIETLTGLHLLKSLGRVDAAVDRFDASNGRFLEAQRRQRSALEAIPPVSELCGAVVVLGILWLGSTVIPIRGDADALLLLPYVFLFYRLLPRFLAILSGRASLSATLSAVPAIEAFLASPEADPIPDGGRAPPAGAQRIAFEGVRFRYAPDQPTVLDGFDLVLEPGKTTALVGPSGAGKSTVVDLVLGLRRPEAGRVTIGDLDLASLEGDSWRRRVGVVPQDPRLFDGSVRENLRLVAPDADDARLHAALDVAAAGFVRDLREGLDTRLGERGARLSGGERQRICIARALLQEPSLLVFDEATSHLDAASERAVAAAIAQAAANRTALVIAHRLSTVRAADRIVFLAGGRVVEAGSHAELLARGGEYARLVRLGLDDLHAASAPPVAASPTAVPPAARA